MFEDELQNAYARDEFVLHYQPIVAARTARIVGMEALLRWRHPQRGLLSPDQFIPQLEQMGLMPGIGTWVLIAACTQSVSWQREGYPPIRMAVNVSPKQFYRDKFAETVNTILRETRLEAKFLELELDETETIEGSDAAIKIMQDLKHIGAVLSLDDFGSGSSSLADLRRFPIDRIKIDRFIVRDYDTGHDADAAARRILGLSRDLGVACIAKGVETQQQRVYFQKLGCREMQGFLYGPPMTTTDCNAFLRQANYESRDLYEPRSRPDR